MSDDWRAAVVMLALAVGFVVVACGMAVLIDLATIPRP